MESKKIYKCENSHYSTNDSKCKHCGGKIIAVIEARYGDCVACGQLCPENAYCCDIPKEKNKNDFIIE